MKKIISLFLISLMLITSTVYLASCSSDNAKADIIGTWTATKEDGSKSEVKFTFNADGTASSSLGGMTLNEGKYTIGGGKAKITWNNSAEGTSDGMGFEFKRSKTLFK